MEITEIFYPKTRKAWRKWLEKNHEKKTEVWLRLFRKDTGKPSLAYDDLVEECLCFGWIDGIVKKLDEESRVQRITPRRKKSFLSELNRQRVWKLQKEGLVMAGALDVIADQIGSPDDPLDIPEFMEKQLKKDKEVWKTFDAFPHFYKRLKVGWIKETGLKSRMPEAQRRLDYLIKMTASGKMYGTQPLKNWNVD